MRKVIWWFISTRTLSARIPYLPKLGNLFSRLPMISRSPSRQLTILHPIHRIQLAPSAFHCHQLFPPVSLRLVDHNYVRSWSNQSATSNECSISIPPPTFKYEIGLRITSALFDTASVLWKAERAEETVIHLEIHHRQRQVAPASCRTWHKYMRRAECSKI